MYKYHVLSCFVLILHASLTNNVWNGNVMLPPPALPQFTMSHTCSLYLMHWHLFSLTTSLSLNPHSKQLCGALASPFPSLHIRNFLKKSHRRLLNSVMVVVLAWQLNFSYQVSQKTFSWLVSNNAFSCQFEHPCLKWPRFEWMNWREIIHCLLSKFFFPAINFVGPFFFYWGFDLWPRIKILYIANFPTFSENYKNIVQIKFLYIILYVLGHYSAQ